MPPTSPLPQPPTEVNGHPNQKFVIKRGGMLINFAL